ncbi:FAD dependent oxidoreductase domain-containing protein [Penicillium odoratum]|uniref:FAD dependent oxidoreductase domain-containing protein n=1 Tax=Penicillium odoratum TaxID=1167516 RepID=UPI002549938F|nr:FAD dependent oxidoreductase domain-containing protein [Penicillium odoratum]KAJ5778453.1 FAD dependent oxidoreductase domain-containing protein [Penicillium odoratum]
MLITIIGAGWNGCHLACELSELGYQIILIDRESQIFAGTSGLFGIRLHRGATLRTNSFDHFREKYRGLVFEHEFSIYANGLVDSENFPSKVSDDTFHKVCMEYRGCKKVDPAVHCLDGISSAYELDEPSVAIGSCARSWFENKLEKARVSVILDTTVLHIKQAAIPNKTKPTISITIQQNKTAGEKTKVRHSTFLTDVAINCTGFHEFVPKAISDPTSPIYFEYTYQVCLALRFRDNRPTSNKPVSFTCMDGWFPCLMPAISDTKDSMKPQRDYILTHGAYTILGSFSTLDKAHHLLSNTLTDEIVAANICGPAESEMRRFWPEFSCRFTYEGWYGTVLAKPKCPTEFRSGFTFEHQGVIHVFPGKVSNVIDVFNEVITLLRTKDVTSVSSDLILQDRGFRFLAGGVFHNGLSELQKRALKNDRSTSSLQTLDRILGRVQEE